MKHLTSERLLIPIAFLTIYFVWGSTYLANWYAIQDVPPFLMSGTRFLTAGLILYIFSQFFGVGKATWRHWKNATFSGTMFLVIGTGGVVWAEQYVNSGIAALVVAFQPLLIVLMMWQMQGKRPAWRTIFGTFLGIVGMGLLVGQDHFISDGNTLTGLIVILVSITAWAYASIDITRLSLPESKLQWAGMQMLTGGTVLFLISIVSGEVNDFAWSNVTPRGIWSWLYLVFFGAIITFSAFNYLLLRCPPDKVATSNYINPIVALLLGWGLNNEVITLQSFFAAVLLLTGVIFINRRKRRTGPSPVERPLHVASLAVDLKDSVKEIDIAPGVKDKGYIARIWKGIVESSRADEYVAWSKNSIVPDLRKNNGNLGLTLHRRTEGNRTYFTLISYWRDMEAVKAFAGADIHKARFFPNEKSMLLEYEENVLHENVNE